MSLTAKDVAEILRLLEESSFDNLSLEIDGMKLNLQRSSPAPMRRVPDGSTIRTSEPATGPWNGTRRSKPPSELGLSEVTAPLLGIFHRAPKPGEAPFIEVGAKVDSETVVGIIEVMKLMNSVRAGVRGEVVEILVENGAAVEYGEILLRVRPEA